ncbi:MAG: NAD(P)/FAD-dependent oxidoreductase [Halanaerobiales bacterium]|nr:NAD(P)/FAD-dependent oxidoreductase [Halanaerobiales bacterium]
MSKAIKIIVIGAGAGGLMAAGVAAKEGADVTIFEKKDRPGIKIMISGKGRCNLTNEADTETFVKNFPDTGRFLYTALYNFSNWQLVDFFEKYGVPTQVERGGRIFTASGKAKDVVDGLLKFLKEFGVSLRLNTPVDQIVISEGKVVGVKTREGKLFPADRVILATGGSSYPGTGSTGDGYKMSEKLGHTIQPLLPSLVPLITEEGWVLQLQGLSLRNVNLTVSQNDCVIGKEFGEMLFTHYGVSGPIVLTMSRDVVSLLQNGPIKASLDLKPALDHETLDQRIQRDFQKYLNKNYKNSLNDLLPKKLIPVVIKLSEISEDKKVHQITTKERRRLGALIKNMVFTIVDHRGFQDAIVTRGGVKTKEINPKTMESKITEGLYFAGEVINIDGYTGGFNLQAAFSTGYLAGFSVVMKG